MALLKENMQSHCLKLTEEQKLHERCTSATTKCAVLA